MAPRFFDLAHIIVSYGPGFPIDTWQSRMPEPLAHEYAARSMQQPLAVHLAPAGRNRRGLDDRARHFGDVRAHGARPRYRVRAICCPTRFSLIFESTLYTHKDWMRLDKLVKTTVAALDDIKARDIVVLDVRKITSLFDKIVIATADSSRQAHALSRNVQEKLKAQGAKVYGVEGEQVGDWILVDLGALVLHIMQPAIRAHYNLEELWTPPRARPARGMHPAGAAKPQAQLIRIEADAHRRRTPDAGVGQRGVRRLRETHAARGAAHARGSEEGRSRAVTSEPPMAAPLRA